MTYSRSSQVVRDRLNDSHNESVAGELGKGIRGGNSNGNPGPAEFKRDIFGLGRTVLSK